MLDVSSQNQHAEGTDLYGHLGSQSPQCAQRRTDIDQYVERQSPGCLERAWAHVTALTARSRLLPLGALLPLIIARWFSSQLLDPNAVIAQAFPAANEKGVDAQFTKVPPRRGVSLEADRTEIDVSS